MMDTLEIRERSHQILDQVDEDFLRVVHATLEAYARQAGLVASYDAITGTPRSASQLTTLLDEEMEAVRRGEFTDFEDFKKESAQWSQGTR